LILELTQRYALQTSQDQISAEVLTQIHKLDAFYLHEVDLDDCDVVFVQRNLLQIEIVAEQAALKLHNLVLVGEKYFQVGQIHECVFPQFRDFVAAQVNHFQILRVLEDAWRNSLDSVLGQDQLLQLSHVSEISKFNESQV
jgi:hypothetical protein